MAERSADSIAELADYVALVYHEARNVRHLIRAGHLSSTGWEKIVSLPVNRNQAWNAIQPVRDKSKQADSISECLRVFEGRFDRDLATIQKMFDDANWRHARLYGGNAWVQIAEDVAKLAQAIRSGSLTEQESALKVLRTAVHNTGPLDEKLRNLDANLV